MDYIGSKTFHTKRDPWPYYMSSSRTLKKDIQAAGMDYLDHFSFDVLFICGDKNSLLLGEMGTQLLENAIHNEHNYNKAIVGQRYLGATKYTMDASINLLPKE